MSTVRKQIKDVFQRTNPLLIGGHYNDVSDMLEKVMFVLDEGKHIEGKVLVAYLSATNAHKEHIIARDKFIDKVEMVLTLEIGSNRARKILKGLR